MNIFENFSALFLEVWKKGILGVDVFQILIGLGIFLIFLLFRGLISKVIISRLKKIAKKTTNKLDDTFVEAMEGPARFLPIVIGFFIASYYLEFSPESQSFIDNLNKSLITILIFWLIHQFIQPVTYLLGGLEKILTKELIGWIVKALKILIFILGAAAVLELWGIKIGPIIAGLGLFGVAVALGAQDLFKNLISGILVLVEKRFKVGDWIIVEGVIEGIVERIGFRSTVIRKFDKSLAIIPNFQFAENAVINVSSTTNWRISWIITLQYNTTIEQLKKVRDEIEKYITSSKDYKISENTEHAVRVDKFSDSSIDMYVRCFTVTDDWSEWLKVKERLALNIKEIVEKKSCFFCISKSVNLCGEKMKSIFILLDSVITIYLWVIIINAILSWLVAFNILNTQNRFVFSILDATYKLTDPALNRIRRFIPTFGSIDISPLVLILALMFLRNLVFEIFAPSLF